MNSTTAILPPALATLARLAAAALLAALLGGCSGVMDKIPFVGGPETTELDSIRLIAPTEMNRNTATAVDILFVFDEATAAVLPKTAPEWFREKRGLINRFHAQMKVVEEQPAPGDVIDEVELPDDYDDAVLVLLYANYIAKTGQHPIDLTLFEEAVVTLNEKEIDYRDAAAR